jgi:molybdate-binding protein
MKLHGSIRENLAAAVRSARRLRGQLVHADTLKHWNDLLHHARAELASGTGDRQLIEPLVAELETEIAGRSR